MNKQVFEIDGSAFDDVHGFFAEFSRKVIPGVDWGENFDALDDVLYGGMGTPEEGFTVNWVDSHRSRQLLSANKYTDTNAWRILMDVFATHPDVELRLL